MANPSQTKTDSGSGRNQQQKAPPAGVLQDAKPVDETGEAGETQEAMNGGAHPRTVKNR